MNKGFVYALIEREFYKTEEPIIKIGMSRKSDPSERLRGYPRGSFYIWLHHTCTPSEDEKSLLDTVRLWFKQRRDIGAEYFEAEQTQLVMLLNTLMQIKDKSRQEIPMLEQEISIDEMFEEFMIDNVDLYTSKCISSDEVYNDIINYVNTNNINVNKKQINIAWIINKCKSYLHASLRPQVNSNLYPLIVFPSMTLSYDKKISLNSKSVFDTFKYSG